MVLTSVPVIDVSPFLEGTPTGKRDVAKQIDKTCTDIGFFTVIGHRVPRDLVERTYNSSKEFFDLPVEEKMKVVRPAPDVPRGYEAVGTEGVSYSLNRKTPGDLKESLTVGPIDVPEDEYYHSPAAGPWFAPNLWPERPKELKEIWSEYFDVFERLGAEIMRMFALALDLPEAFFDDKIDKPTNVFRVLNYPVQLEEPLPGQLRAGEHSDYGTLTIVRQEDRPGVCRCGTGWVNGWTPRVFPIHLSSTSVISCRCGPMIGGFRPCTGWRTLHGTSSRGADGNH